MYLPLPLLLCKPFSKFSWCIFSVLNYLLFVRHETQLIKLRLNINKTNKFFGFKFPSIKFVLSDTLTKAN